MRRGRSLWPVGGGGLVVLGFRGERKGEGVPR